MSLDNARLYDDAQRAIQALRLAEAKSSGKEVSRRMGEQGTTVFGLRKNGEEFPADAAISRLGVSGASIHTVALRDATEQKRIESDQRFLTEVGTALASTLDYEETLSSIAKLALLLLPDFCIIDIVEEGGEIPRHRIVGRDPARQSVCDSLMQIRSGTSSCRRRSCGGAAPNRSTGRQSRSR